MKETGRLPAEYFTQERAFFDAGWRRGALSQKIPNAQIGGDVFFNEAFPNGQRLLPQASGRIWHEADLLTKGAIKRGESRLLYSNDGLIYVTTDHYETAYQIGTWTPK